MISWLRRLFCWTPPQTVTQRWLIVTEAKAQGQRLYREWHERRTDRTNDDIVTQFRRRYFS